MKCFTFPLLTLDADPGMQSLLGNPIKYREILDNYSVQQPEIQRKYF